MRIVRLFWVLFILISIIAGLVFTVLYFMQEKDPVKEPVLNPEIKEKIDNSSEIKLTKEECANLPDESPLLNSNNIIMQIWREKCA